MPKFFTLFTKEVRELVTPLALIPLVLTMVLFFGLGKVLDQENNKLKAPQPIAILDLDQSATSGELKRLLEKSNFKVSQLSQSTIEQALASAKQNKQGALLIFPPGLESKVKAGQPQPLPTYIILRSFTMNGARITQNLDSALYSLNEQLASQTISQRLTGDVPLTSLKNPLSPQQHVVIGNRQAQVSAAAIFGFLSTQTIFIPVILFMVILFAAQMIATSIATEKENKTLETLLSTPVSRLAIVTSKLLAAGFVALVYALVYMLGFRSYLNGITGGASLTKDPGVANAVKQLGLSFASVDYLLLGLSLFFAILCALVIALILGIFADDVKSVQGVITPLTIIIAVPYILSLFLDFTALSPGMKFAVNAIPFSHPFLAPQYIWQHNYPPILLGIVYQLGVFLAAAYLAIRIFSSDRVLTLKFKLKKDKRLTA